MSTALPSAAVIPEQVYPGLRPFRRDESILFFGRQEHVDELLGRLEETSFLAVVGLSGSGKSSLVLAGLVPALERGHLAGAGALWQIVGMRPGSDPLGALAAALNEALGESPQRAPRLRSGRLGLVDAASAGRKPGANLLLVVDQFEEIFRFQRDFEVKAHEAAEFVRLLLAASSDYDARLYVVITMRSDYLGESARFPGLAEALNGSQYLTPRLTKERLREATAGPAALLNVTVDPRWLESVLDQTSDNPDQLPVLQHLLRQMWNRKGRGPVIGEVDFNTVGGLKALDTHAVAVYGAVGHQDLTRRVFQSLTESAEPGRENRRPRKMLELVEETGSDFTAVKAVVDHFREEGCSFLSPPEDRELKPDSVIDITHESLIRGWARLREWVRADSDAGEWYRRVEDRLRTSEGKVYLEGPELEAAIQARREGGWNSAWAKRYAGKEPKEYGDVVRWLENSQRESAMRARRRLWALAGVAIVLAILAGGASWAAWLINQEKSRAEGASADAIKSASNALEYAKAARHDRDAATRAEQQKSQALEKLEKAQEVLQKSLLVQLGLTQKARARELSANAATWKSDDPARALYFGLQAAKLERQSPGLESVLATALSNGPGYALIQGHQNSVTSVAWSPDGKTLASASSDRSIRLWEAASGQPLRTIQGHTSSVSSVVWSPDGKTLASASSDRTIRLWDAATGQPLRTLQGHTGSVYSVAWSPDGKTLASASNDRTIRLWEASGQPPRTIQGLQNPAFGVIYSVAWSPDGKALASASSDGSIGLWEAASGQPLRTIQGHRTSVYSVVWSPDGKSLASASYDGTIRLWDAATGQPLRTLQGHTNAVNSVVWSPDGKTLASAGDDATVRLWDAASGRPLRTIQGQQGRVSSVAWSPDGNTLASASYDRTIRLWEAASGQPLRTIQGHQDLVYDVAWSPDGRTLASAGLSSTIRLWEAVSGQPLRTLQGHQNAFVSVAWSPDGKALASASSDHTIWLWEAGSGQVLRTLQGHENYVRSVAWSPNGKTLASASEDQTIRLWEVASGQPLHTLQGHQRVVTSVAWSPNGKTLASSSDDGTIRLWDAATGRPLRTLEGHQGSVYSVAWSPDGRTLASASGDSTIRLWDMPGGRPVQTLLSDFAALQPGVMRTFNGLLRIFNGVAWSPDGKTLAAASTDNTIRLWDAATGQPLRTLLGHSNSVNRVAWSPDGKTLASASADDTIRLWPGSVDALLDQARERIRLFTLPKADCERYFGTATCPPVR